MRGYSNATNSPNLGWPLLDTRASSFVRLTTGHSCAGRRKHEKARSQSNLFHDRQEHRVTLIGFAFNREIEHEEETPNMRKIALLALGMSCVSASSIAGGVPNPVSPLGVDPRTQQPVSHLNASL
jgi:hypothetical protein